MTNCSTVSTNAFVSLVVMREEEVAEAEAVDLHACSFGFFAP
jgi:hypothetical protein